jgi:hypothetical protein
VCGTSEEEFREFFSITQSNQRKKFSRSPKAHELIDFLDHYQICAKRFIEGAIDYVALERQVRGDEYYIPEQYKECALSRMHTLANILDSVERRTSFEHRREILSYFQIREPALAKENSRINVRLLLDFVDHVRKKYSIGPTELYKIGIESHLRNKSSEIGKRFGTIQNTANLYECVIEELFPLFDENTSYRILKMESDQITVEAKDNNFVKDALSLKCVANEYSNSWKAGVLASFPLYLNRRPAHVRFIQKDDERSIFEIDYSQVRPPLEPSQRA